MWTATSIDLQDTQQRKKAVLRAHKLVFYLLCSSAMYVFISVYAKW